VREVVDCCRRLTGKNIPVVERARRPGDPPRLIAASDRIRTDLGWTPRFQSIEAIVRSAWDWHLRHPGGYGD
jgi:UDP-glucose 4-epimerase